MPTYLGPDGEKIWFGKRAAITGIVIGVGIAAVGSYLVGSTLDDLIERYQESRLSYREARSLFVSGALGIYGLYEGVEFYSKSVEIIKRIQRLEKSTGRKIQSNDYPRLFS